jgi:hypothetical protein
LMCIQALHFATNIVVFDLFIRQLFKGHFHN